MCQEALDLERSNGEGAESKCWKDEDHDLWYGLDRLQSSGEFPCAFCRTGVGSNSIFCNGCEYWVHRKYSGLKRLTKDPDYRCSWYQGTARHLDNRPQREIQVGPGKLEVVASFCYLGDMLSTASGCVLSTTTCVKNTWKKFKELLPVFSSRHLSFKHMATCTALVCGAQCSMPVGIGHWPLTKPNLRRLQRNDRAMIRQICNIKPQDIVTTMSNELLAQLGIDDQYLILKEWRLSSQDSLGHTFMESVGLGSPRWHGSSWQIRIAESGTLGYRSSW